VLYELTPRTVSLEQAFMDLTQDATDYTAHSDTRQHEAAHHEASTNRSAA
jgi:hypothetical protein